MQTLGEKMRAARLERGETQDDVARRMGVKFTNYQRWETDKHAPELAAFLTICDYFGWDRPKDLLIVVPDVDSRATGTRPGRALIPEWVTGLLPSDLTPQLA